jgi:hypothetical protein
MRIIITERQLETLEKYFNYKNNVVLTEQLWKKILNYSTNIEDDAIKNIGKELTKVFGGNVDNIMKTLSNKLSNQYNTLKKGFEFGSNIFIPEDKIEQMLNLLQNPKATDDIKSRVINNLKNYELKDGTKLGDNLSLPSKNKATEFKTKTTEPKAKEGINAQISNAEEIETLNKETIKAFETIELEELLSKQFEDFIKQYVDMGLLMNKKDEIIRQIVLQKSFNKALATNDLTPVYNSLKNKIDETARLLEISKMPKNVKTRYQNFLEKLDTTLISYRKEKTVGGQKIVKRNPKTNKPEINIFGTGFRIIVALVGIDLTLNLITMWLTGKPVKGVTISAISKLTTPLDNKIKDEFISKIEDKEIFKITFKDGTKKTLLPSDTENNYKNLIETTTDIDIKVKSIGSKNNEFYITIPKFSIEKNYYNNLTLKYNKENDSYTFIESSNLESIDLIVSEIGSTIDITEFKNFLKNNLKEKYPKDENIKKHKNDEIPTDEIWVEYPTGDGENVYQIKFKFSNDTFNEIK